MGFAAGECRNAKPGGAGRPGSQSSTLPKVHYHFMGSPSIAEYQNVACYVHKTVLDTPLSQEWQRQVYGLRDSQVYGLRDYRQLSQISVTFRNARKVCEMIKLVWSKCPDGYGVQTRSRSIVARTGRRITYASAMFQHHIFLELVTMPPNGPGISTFVDKWGLLTRNAQTEEEFINESVKLRDATCLAEERGIVELIRKFPLRRFGHLRIGYDRKPGQSAPGLFYYPQNLLTFCWIEMLQFVVGNVEIVECPVCGKFSQRKKNGRAREYCSNSCKQAAYRERSKSRIKPSI